LVQHRPNLTSQTIAGDGRAERTPEGEPDLWGVGIHGLEAREGERTSSPPACIGAEPCKEGAISKAVNQADSRSRPLARRARKMARPARVDMR
jgi:hypothetical protein